MLVVDAGEVAGEDDPIEVLDLTDDAVVCDVDTFICDVLLK